jgi:hypothetical protein
MLLLIVFPQKAGNPQKSHRISLRTSDRRAKTLPPLLCPFRPVFRKSSPFAESEYQQFKIANPISSPLPCFSPSSRTVKPSPSLLSFLLSKLGKNIELNKLKKKKRMGCENSRLAFGPK